MNKLKINYAFTLIELLVVISIIGILIALSVFGLQGARKSARDGQRKTNLEQIRSALEIYKSDCNKYPLTGGFTTTIKGDDSTASCQSTNIYLQSVPTDPIPSTQNYSYVSSDGLTYKLCASLENTPSPTPNPTLLQGCSCGTACNYVVANP